MRSRYCKGKLNGSYTEYHSNGKPKVKKKYKKGQPTGKATVYDESGKIIHRVAYAKGKVYLYGDARSRTPFEIYPRSREEIVKKVVELRPRKFKGRRYDGKGKTV